MLWYRICVARCSFFDALNYYWQLSVAQHDRWHYASIAHDTTGAVFILGIHRGIFPQILYSPKTYQVFFVFGPRIIHCYKKLTIKLLFNFNNFNSRLPATAVASTTLNILTLNMHILAWFRAFWAIMRQYRSKRLITARTSEKNCETKSFQLLGASPPRSPEQGLCPWTRWMYSPEPIDPRYLPQS